MEAEDDEMDVHFERHYMDQAYFEDQKEELKRTMDCSKVSCDQRATWCGEWEQDQVLEEEPDLVVPVLIFTCDYHREECIEVVNDKWDTYVMLEPLVSVN